jgi:RHS repeat-associated protein
VNPLRYVGAFGYYREAAERYYVRARWLDVAQGRWLSQDPLGKSRVTWNDYTYADLVPTVHADPSGELIIDVSCTNGRLFPPGCNCPGSPPNLSRPITRIRDRVCGSGGITSIPKEQWRAIFECARRKVGKNRPPPPGIDADTLRKCMIGYCSGAIQWKIECRDTSDPNCRDRGLCAYSLCNTGTPGAPYNRGNIVICINVAMNCDAPGNLRWNLDCSCSFFAGKCSAADYLQGSCLLIHEMAHGCGFCSDADPDQWWVDAIACCIHEAVSW